MSVFWLALAAFAIGTEGFVIAGLLPGIAADLQISVSAAGQLVTAYALTYAVGSPILAVTLNNVDRRTVLALALSTFIAGNLVAMMTSGYMLLLASRMLMALGAGLCMPTALGVSVAVASPERRGRAVALVTSGITVATVVGVPLGNFVGSLFGWRATFAMVALLGTVALAGLLFGLPRGLPRNTASLAERLAVARHGNVLIALLITILWALGGFTVFTYFAVPLKSLGFDASRISLALLVFGGAAAIGNMLGGVLADRLGTLATAALGLAGMATALILHSLVLKLMPGQPHYAVLGAILLWGISGWAFYPAQLASIIRIEPQASMIALSLNASAMYLGFAIGGALGGAVLTTLSPTDLGWVGGSSVTASLLVHLARGWQARPKPVKIAG
ncbi:MULTISPECIES: MFS transporter [unclassified Bradyrhizobium]|uniref:MFS transporter n=1 Tax=unclassified Bradyrhizobium TaxID=2631580 RepID=UPI002478ACE5|nr:MULTISPECIES: MFS transporter [unclassified Bradyrhizobium]WGR72616.1 MFS transporter [Bradyrhizobium sp. ISRA426]WGR77449.1 MFS transporter [Bradyrhizobium sp. ISRA430]WGR87855.1 MFS transporter [Bradyrhizobium sp. ISRA432]